MLQDTMMMNLPEDTIAHVLSHVPVKSLLRFRCVSRLWCSMIKSEYFVKLHLRNSVHNSTTKLNLILQDLESGRSYLSVTVGPQYCQQGIVDLQAPFDCWTTRISGSCNGLLCLRKTNYQYAHGKCCYLRKIALWNPSTKRTYMLPDAPMPKEEIARPYDLRIDSGVEFEFAFGYDSVNDDYKVLRIMLYTTGMPHHDPFCEIAIYSLRADSWKPIVAPSYLHPMKRRGFQYMQEHVLLREAFHWSLELRHGLDIVAFDIGREEFRTIPLPKLDPSSNYHYVNLVALEQCLGFLGSAGFVKTRTDIWMMRDYGVKDSWVKLFSLNEFSYTAAPLAYSRDSDDHKVLTRASEGFRWYNLKKKTDEYVEFHPSSLGAMIPSTFDAYAFVGSLVSPFPS